MAKRKAFLLLLNSAPSIWRAMEEFHFRLAQALAERGLQPLIGLANEVPQPILKRFEASGAHCHVLTYRNRVAFRHTLHELRRTYSVDTAHIRFYQYFHGVSWRLWANGFRRLVFTDAESGRLSAGGLKRVLKRLRTRVTTWPNHRMIAISEFVKTRLVDAGVNPSRIAVIHNGVDLTRFQPSPTARRLLHNLHGIPDDHFILSTISRLVELKRVDVLLAACALLKRRNLRFRFLVAGQGGLESSLRQQAQALGIADEVIWLGATANPEELLQGSDLFLLGTEGEAFGNVLVEAMACGVPVVGNKSGSMPEIVQNAVTGLLAEPGSAESYAQQISLLLTDSDLRLRMSTAALERAHLFDVHSSVANTITLYQSLGLVA